MELSARIFGVNSWSVLVPQVLLGVATVALLHAAVKRAFGPRAGLLAGALLALTPVATLMFRYNNPDALLVFLMVVAGWAVLRAVEDGRTRWLVLCGAAVGLGFLTKQLQVMLIVPALAGTYQVCGPPRPAMRLRQLGAAAGAMIVAAGWWVLLVSLTPADQRPYVGGSTDNSFMNLTFGYNGLARLTGRAHQGPPNPEHFGGLSRSHPGVLRLFTAESAGQISWLLPAALILGTAGLIWLWGVPRTDPRRAHYLLWGGWLLVGAVVLSAMSGMYHDYYTVALAPAVAALAGTGAVQAWRRPGQKSARLVLATAVATTAVWSWILLGRTTDFVPPLRWVVLVAGVVAALLVALQPNHHRIALAATAIAVLGGPVAYCVQTVAGAQHGGMVIAGPRLPGAFPHHGGFHGMAMEAGDVSSTITGMLDADASAFTWVAATEGANQAAAYQLTTGHPVMPIGGFIGRDPSPTLERFQSDVAEGRIHYFIERPHPDKDEPNPMGPPDDPDSEANRITTWVTHTFTARTVDGVTVYDLTARAGGSR
jgi:4-amino-4-deoxy-L-arabinose transferase-like glycosyltransferase